MEAHIGYRINVSLPVSAGRFQIAQYIILHMSHFNIQHTILCFMIVIHFPSFVFTLKGTPISQSTPPHPP